MPLGFSLPDPRRIRSYFFRLPLATRALLCLLLGFYVAHLFSPDVNRWGALVPQEIKINSRKSSQHPSNISYSHFLQCTD